MACVRGRGWCETDASIMVIQHCGLISGNDASQTDSKYVSFELRIASGGWTGWRCVSPCVQCRQKGTATRSPCRRRHTRTHTQTQAQFNILLISALQATLWYTTTYIWCPFVVLSVTLSPYFSLSPFTLMIQIEAVIPFSENETVSGSGRWPLQWNSKLVLPWFHHLNLKTYQPIAALPPPP
jgi:hypothetical protein